MKRILFVVALALAACQEPSDEVIHDPGQLHAGDTLRWMASAPDLFDGEWKFNGQPDDAFRARVVSDGVVVVKQPLVRAAAFGTPGDTVCVDETVHVHYGVDTYQKLGVLNSSSGSLLSWAINISKIASEAQQVVNGAWAFFPHTPPYWAEFPMTSGGTVTFPQEERCSPIGCQTVVTQYLEGVAGHYKRCWIRGTGVIVRAGYRFRCPSGDYPIGLTAGPAVYLDDVPGSGMTVSHSLDVSGLFLDTPGWQLIGQVCGGLGSSAFSPHGYCFCSGASEHKSCYLWPYGSTCALSDYCAQYPSCH